MTWYIDPGTTKGCAVAAFRIERFSEKVLVGLGMWYPDHGFKKYWGVSGLGPAVWEKPQLYPGQKQPAQYVIATANDLIDLSGAGALCAGVLGWGRGGVSSKLPRQWKKQLPKPVPHMRAMGVLTRPELDLIAEAYGKPLQALLEYIKAACYKSAQKKKNLGYGAEIVDLLDAVCFGLVEEGRLVL